MSRGFSQSANGVLSRHFRAVSDTAGKRRKRTGTVRHKRSNICGGVVQLVRTAYSHSEQQIMKEISTAAAARGAVLKSL